MLTQSDINLIKFIIDKDNTSVQYIANCFGKNSSSIRREIDNINLHYNEPILYLKNSIISTNLNYTQYTKLIENLDFNTYFPSVDDRISIMLFSLFFNDIVNLTTLYEGLNLSITTKKNDTKVLIELLNKNDLHLEIVKKKGVRVVGSELRFRILILERLHLYIDLIKDTYYDVRKANNPYQIYALNIGISKLNKLVTYKTNKQIQQIIDKYHINFSYLHYKFLYLYLVIADFRINIGKLIKNATKINLILTDVKLFEDENENIEVNNILGGLDVTPKFNIPLDTNLYMDIISLTNNVIKDLGFSFANKQAIIQDLYNYIYQKICDASVQFYIKDRLVETASNRYPNTYQSVKNHSKIFYNHYGITFTDSHLSTITLIFRRFNTINNIAKRNNARVIIASNINYERILYFAEILKSNFSIDVVGRYSLDNLDEIKSDEFDLIITFSNRFYIKLKERFENVVKVSFFLTEEDLSLFRSLNFKPSKKCFIAEDFGKILENKSKNEIIEILKRNYEDYFI